MFPKHSFIKLRSNVLNKIKNRGKIKIKANMSSQYPLIAENFSH